MRTIARLLAWLAVLAGIGIAAAVGAGYALYLSIVRDLPDLHRIEDYRPPLASTVYDRDGKPIGEFFDERRRLVALKDVPRHVVLAFVAGEDDNFFTHGGIDVRSILRAAWVDLTSGEIVQGASTITQQTVKSLLLTPERHFDRKLKEMILARRLEQRFSKDEILTLYLNQIYFGSGAWGIAEAARTYFGKPVGELTVSEGALLAGLPKAPSRFSPNVKPAAAEERRKYVLSRMSELGFIDAATYAEALKQKPVIRGPRERDDFDQATWLTEEVRRLLFDRLGGDAVLRGGLRIDTTLDLRLQRSARTALRAGLEALDRREGWLGPVRHVERRELDAELPRLAESNGLATAAKAGGAPPLDPARSWLGVVVALDTGHQTARVALAPGIAGEVALADVAWARRRDVEHESVPRTRIEQVFAVGDVARFRVLPADAQAPVPDAGDPEGTVPPPSGVEAAQAAEDPSARPDAKGVKRALAPAPAWPAAAPLRLTIDQSPQVEGALLSLDVASGEVLALVGGYDYGRSQFDRAVQARRQPGSAFKPFIYATALQRGFTAVTTVSDTQVVYTDPVTGEVWRPENYDGKFLGPVPLREALARSLNNATIHVLFDVGIRPVIDMAHGLGIRSPLAPYPSIALGTSPVSLVELTCAYAAFPAGGRRVDPIFIRRVVDRDGKTLLQNLTLDEPEPDEPGTPPHDAAPAPDLKLAAQGGGGGREQVIPEALAFLVTDLMRAPIEHPHGTARKAKALDRPLAGKTGTTNDQGDAWFVGFSPDLVAGVWVGFDERQVLGKGETGGHAALPIWIDYMRDALADRTARDFPVPAGVSYARIDPSTGKLADGGSHDAYFQSFLEGHEPTQSAGEAPSDTESRRMLRMDF